MYRSVLVLAVITCLYSEPVLADQFDSGWVKVEKSALDDLSVSHGDTRVNNFTLTDDKAFLSGGDVVKFSCSIRNKGSEVSAVSVQVVGVDSAGELTFALCAEPPFGGMISGGKTEELSKNFLTSAAAVGKATQVKYRIIILQK